MVIPVAFGLSTNAGDERFANLVLGEFNLFVLSLIRSHFYSSGSISYHR